MKQYKLVDNIFGWVAFIIAAFVYCLNFNVLYFFVKVYKSLQRY